MGEHPDMKPQVYSAVAALLLLAVCAAALPAAAADGPEKLYFKSGGKDIEADLYPAAGPGPHRAVIVMHGAGGILFDGPEMRRVARQLAGAGDTAYLLHYFNRTGSIGVRDAAMQEHFDDWLGTVRDAITWVHAREAKETPTIGIYGYSLGAFLAVAAASDNPFVGAIVEQAGGMWNSQEQRVGKMPPVLMVHGRADQRVPFDKYAAPLLQVLRERGGKVETHFVDGEGHGFSQPAMVIVRAEAVQFFANELKP